MGRPRKRKSEDDENLKKKGNTKQESCPSVNSKIKVKRKFVEQKINSGSEDVKNTPKPIKIAKRQKEKFSVLNEQKYLDSTPLKKKKVKEEAEDSGYEPSSFSTDSGEVCLGTVKNESHCKAKLSETDQKNVEDCTSSDSEWEEVEEACEQSLDEYEPDIPKEGIEITIDCPDINIRKRTKQKFDEMEYIRLYINRTRKETQLCMHKVHLLCLISHGFYVNGILNSSNLKGMALSLIPPYLLAETRGKKVDKIDVDGIEKVMSWFCTTFNLESNKDAYYNLEASLTWSLETQKCMNPSEYNLLFVAIARTLNLKARFCISLYPVTYKAGNLIKKIKSKESRKCNLMEETNKSAIAPCSSKFSVNREKPTKNSKVKPSSSTTTKLEDSFAPQNKRKLDKNSKKENFDAKTVQSKSNLRPKRSVGKNYKVSSDDSGDDSKDEDFSAVDNEKDSDKDSGKSKKLSRSKLQKKEQLLKVPKKSNRKVLSSDSEPPSPDQSFYKPENILCWAEVFSKPNKQWITVECVNKLVNKTSDIEPLVPHPVTYILAYDNESYVKDVTRRYCNEFMTCTRKMRADPDWWDETLEPFLPPNSKLDREEEKKMDQMLNDKPLPATVAGFKNHPLYALKRHLLKFEAIYPPDAPPVGFFRQEPVYARDCVCQLHSRENWVKEARVVRIGEEPYKIVKARPKWDKIAGVMRTDLPLGIFGHWQTEPYEPPIAVDGKVPRNEYGNVELFKPCMLPKGTVHLQIPCLNRVARKLGIDCSPAVVGFDGHKGSIHPVFDGFVVCEEFKETLLAAWEEEQENTRKREMEKREKRIYGNWRKLIKGLLIREHIKIKYKVN